MPGTPDRKTSRVNVSPRTESGEAVVVLGTSAAVAELTGHMRSIAASPEVLGCLLVDHRGEHAVAGLPVLGRADELASVHEALGFTAALVTMPGEGGDRSREFLAELRRLGIESRVVPMVSELVAGRVAGGAPAPSVPAVVGRGVDVSALIGRRAHGLDRAAVDSVLRGRRVLITGAGGSIGSELARIVAGFAPAELVLMERSENALFEIDRQLGWGWAGVARRAVLHDVVDAVGTRAKFASLEPEVVFHAAAHKHVPLMEDHPWHAAENNVFGTSSVLEASIACGTERFVLVSTDKAVRPKSVMGATKRLAELCVRSAGAREGARTRCCAVRFGNVLGSAGSVLPIWSAQLGEGGPITVTDARMTRYFMTIPEAATLVVQACAMAGEPGRAGGGEVFVLDMGEPVRVLELAERFVRLHGYEARVVGAGSGESLDGWIGMPGSRARIDITITGARPGEKLHEALAYEAETLSATAHPGIRVLRDEAETGLIDASAMLSDLRSASSGRAPDGSGDRAAVLAALARWVPELATPAEEPKPAGKAKTREAGSTATAA